jgi:ribosomal RNA assembly protein
MTETIFMDQTGNLRKDKSKIEEKLEVKIKVEGKKVTIEGEEVKEYEALIVLDAIKFGFPVKTALLAANEGMIFRTLPMKHFTRRKDMEDVRGRIIGTEGKTKRTIEQVSGCSIVIQNNHVGVIGPAESIEEATTAITNLIRGTKQSNVYRFLEKMNAEKKIKSDLGLKNEKEASEGEEESKNN